MKPRKDSFDFFLNLEGQYKGPVEDPLDWKPVASEGSPQGHRQKESFLNKRANSEASFGDLESSENNYAVVSFLVKLLLHREKCTFDELLGSVVSAYDTLRGGRAKCRVDAHLTQTVLKRKLKDCLAHTSLFFCDKDKYWSLTDKDAASTYLLGLRDTLSKKSETTISPRQEENQEVGKSKQLKRRYQRGLDKYEQTITVLEDLCGEYGTMLKNPFSGLAGKDKEEQLRGLGSAEKILGLLQCYNYFAPLIAGGLKRLKTKETSSVVSNNLLGVSRVLLSLANQVDLQKHKDHKEHKDK